MVKVSKFFGFETPLSNFRFANFTVMGKTYTSVEMYYQFMKAEYFNDKEAMDAIMSAETPAEQRRIGQNVKNFNEKDWERVSEQYMYTGCLAKVFFL